ITPWGNTIIFLSFHLFGGMRLSGAHQRAAKHRIDMFLKGSDCSFLEHINCIIINGKRIGFITFLQIGIF
ncbi:MAG: hypothetical protein ACI32B_08165, partial [Erysipelotrichaceae bacterium]